MRIRPIVAGFLVAGAASMVLAPIAEAAPSTVRPSDQ